MIERTNPGGSPEPSTEEPEAEPQSALPNEPFDDSERSPRSLRQVLTLLASPLLDESGSSRSVVFGLFSLSLIGCTIGFLMPKNPALPTPWYRYVSSAVGYVYFIEWSASFWPQVLSNRRRKSCAGLSMDFCALNVLGFACYSVYNVAFFYSPTIQRLYRERYGPDAEITVQSNDVAFALHAFLLSSVTFLQIVYYDGLRNQKPKMVVLVFVAAVGLICVIYPFMVLVYPVAFNWLDYLYFLSFVKIFISLIKYIPQVILNYQRKSTVGWSIWNIILDFSGGVLSDLQLVLDCADLKDFTGITGNVAKFSLGSISILFDVVFLLQHYVLYAEDEERSEAEPLLPSNHASESSEEPETMRV